MSTIFYALCDIFSSPNDYLTRNIHLEMKHWWSSRTEDGRGKRQMRGKGVGLELKPSADQGAEPLPGRAVVF